VALVKLGNQKGYKLIGANQLGFNFIFVKQSLASEELPEVDVQTVLKHPSVRSAMNGFSLSGDKPYVTPIP
jgi:hypothetical protein